MSRTVHGFCAGFLALTVLPALAQAYSPDALAWFQAGKQDVAGGQLKQAVGAYRAALKADPTLTMAYKALGTVYYEAGDRKGALFYYDRYLTANPDDAATRRFADGLRQSLGAGAPAAPASAAAAPGAANAGPFIPGFDVRVPVTAAMASASSGGDKSPGSTTSIVSGLGVDYGMSGGFVFGLDALVGPSYSDSASGDTSNFDEISVLLTPGWRFRLGSKWVVEPRLGLGLVSSSISNSVASIDPNTGAPTTVSSKISGMGYELWPEIRAEYLFGNLGVGGSLGYFDASTSFAAAGGGKAVSDTLSGLSIGVFGVWHFNPLF